MGKGDGEPRGSGWEVEAAGLMRALGGGRGSQVSRVFSGWSGGSAPGRK